MSERCQPTEATVEHYEELKEFLADQDLALVQRVASDDGDTYSRVERYAASRVLKDWTL